MMGIKIVVVILLQTFPIKVPPQPAQEFMIEHFIDVLISDV